MLKESKRRKSLTMFVFIFQTTSILIVQNFGILVNHDRGQVLVDDLDLTVQIPP